MDKDDIDSRNLIHKYGVGSLVAIKMDDWFAKDVGADLGTTEILSGTGIVELAARVAKRSGFVENVSKF